MAIGVEGQSRPDTQEGKYYQKSRKPSHVLSRTAASPISCSHKLESPAYTSRVRAGSPKRGTATYPTIGYATDGTRFTLIVVQRLFTTFPPGWPGVGLLFLRSSVAIALPFESALCHPALPGWMQAVAILLSITLLAGYLTPIVAVVCLFVHALIWCRVGTGSTADAIIVCLDLTALALLGPGGYSVDAFRFGRRVIVVPPP